MVLLAATEMKRQGMVVNKPALPDTDGRAEDLIGPHDDSLRLGQKKFPPDHTQIYRQHGNQEIKAGDLIKDQPRSIIGDHLTDLDGDVPFHYSEVCLSLYI